MSDIKEEEEELLQHRESTEVTRRSYRKSWACRFLLAVVFIVVFLAGFFTDQAILTLRQKLPNSNNIVAFPRMNIFKFSSLLILLIVILRIQDRKVLLRPPSNSTLTS